MGAPAVPRGRIWEYGVRGLASPVPLAGAAQHVAGIFGGASQHVARCVWSGQCTRWPVAWGQGLGIP